MKFSELVLRVIAITVVSIAISREYSIAAGAFVFISLGYQLEALLLARVWK